MRFALICAVALALAGCADISGRSSSLTGDGSASSPRPKTIVVSDFAMSSDIVVLDRGFTARLERKIGAYPTHERKTRTLDRVNDEMVAAVVATLREAGLDAQPGSEEGVSLSDSAVIVTGRLRPANPAAKKNEAGIGGGRGGVTADMTLSTLGGFGKKQLLAFAVEPGGGKAAAASKTFNAAVAGALATGAAAPEKLSPDVEAAARKIGRAAGDKIVDYARTQGWFGGGDATADAAPVADEKPAKPPAVRRAAAKPEAKPDASADADTKPVAQAKPDPKPKATRQPAKKPAEDAPADSDDTPAAD